MFLLWFSYDFLFWQGLNPTRCMVLFMKPNVTSKNWLTMCRRRSKRKDFIHAESYQFKILLGISTFTRQGNLSKGSDRKK